MGNRRFSRELVIQFLYLTEMNEGDTEDQLESFWKNNTCKEEDVQSFTEDILRNIFDHKKRDRCSVGKIQRQLDALKNDSDRP